MSTQHLPQMKLRVEEPPNPKKPDPERPRKGRSGETENPDPGPRRDKQSPEIPHDPQDVPEQELRNPA